MTLAYLIGLMLGDGGLYGKSYTVFCRDMDEAFVRQCTEIVRQLLGFEPRIKKLSPNCFVLSTNRKDIHKFFCDIGFPKGRKLTTSHIPSIALKTENDRIDVVGGLFDAEGYCGIDRQRHYGRIYSYPYVGIDMISGPIVAKVSSMLKELGIEHSMRVKKARAWGKHPQYIIVIKGREQVEKFGRSIGFRHPVKAKKLKDILGDPQRPYVGPDGASHLGDDMVQP